jgi:hypothetical protein
VIYNYLNNKCTAVAKYLRPLSQAVDNPLRLVAQMLQVAQDLPHLQVLSFLISSALDKNSKELFLKKLQICMKVYDYNDETKDVKGKVSIFSLGSLLTIILNNRLRD